MINPAEYTRLFSLKESLMTCWFEVEERKRMTLDGYPNVSLVYIDGEFFLRKKDMAQYNLTNKELHKAIDLVKERCEAYLAFSKKQEKDFSEHDWEALMWVFSDFMKTWGSLMRIIDIPVYASDAFEKRIHDAVIKADFKETDFDILTHPLTPSYHQERHRDVCFVKQGKLTREAFKERWAWSQMIIFQRHAVDDTFIDEQLDNIKDSKAELKGLEAKQAAGKQAFERLFTKLPATLQEDATLIQRMLRIRDYRFAAILKGAYSLGPFLDELAKRLKISYDQLIHLTPNEIKAKNTISCDERMEGYANSPDGILVGEEMEALKARFNPRKEKHEIRGKGVSAGIATGPARIVRSIKDLHKVQKGDVIVCDLTSPDYMAALQKVVAIVANIGGFTSHSAIVSREFGIPCVVGTGDATNSFTDGDILEVDGERGIVKKVG